MIATVAGVVMFAVSASAAPPTLTLTTGDTVVGGTIHASAQLSLSESLGATGEISFKLFGPGDTTCEGAVTYEASVPVSGAGEYGSGDFAAPAAGVYRWSAQYSGDSENEPANAECSASSTVAKASPGLTATASSATVGGNIHDEATVIDGFSPTGEVTFRVYAPTDTLCATPLETLSGTISGGHASSGNFLAEQVGVYRWTAEYPGDANNEAVSTACGESGQSSTVAKASPGLTATATAAVQAGQTITDSATLSAGFSPTGHLVFRAYGPGDETCTGAVAYEASVTVSGNGLYAPAGFAPGAGVYRWTAEYPGDANNEAVSTACGESGQSSAVGAVAVTVSVSATGGTIGSPVNATAMIQKGALPLGQITFQAFPPDDQNCSGPAVFSSSDSISGNGSYRSTDFVPSQVGAFRWIVVYSGDGNHTPASTGCGDATSNVSRATPSIAGQVPQRRTVGARFRDTATLLGGYRPTGTVTFRIYGPLAKGCAKPAYVSRVPVAGNGVIRSAPFVPKRPGRYNFVASYSGDASNQGAAEPCEAASQVVVVRKRGPKVKPRAYLTGHWQILIRARLTRAASPFGVIAFRLYRPGDKRCRRTPLFSGGLTVRSNGTYLLARYLATRAGLYRLVVGYSGDARNKQYKAGCKRAQRLRVR